MKTMNSLLTLAALLAAGVLSCGTVSAQQPGGGGGGGFGGGGFNMDPQQIQQMMMNLFRDRLVVTNDDEWKVIEGRLSKVMQLRTETLMGGMGFSAFRGMGRGGNGGGGGGGGAQMRGMRGLAGMGQPLPEAEALQTSLDNEAPNAEVKARLEKYREAHKKKMAELAAAQKDLREVLSLRQEAVLVSMGMLE